MSAASSTTVIDHPILDPALAPPFPVAALPVLRNSQLRKNVAHAIDVIQAKRARLVAEKTDWQALRAAAAAIKTTCSRIWASYLEQFEAAVHRGRRHGALGWRMRPMRGGSFWNCCAKRRPTRSSRSRP